MSDRHQIMNDTPFWMRLEFAAGAWLNDNVRRGYWLDGLSPDGIRNTRHGVEVEGTAWVCFGSDVRPPFRFFVSVPQKMLHRRREAFVVETLLLDEARKELKISLTCEELFPSGISDANP